MLKAFKTVYEVVPDLEALRPVEIVISESQLNARFERFVEGPDPIACKYEDPCGSLLEPMLSIRSRHTIVIF